MLPVSPVAASPPPSSLKPTGFHVNLALTTNCPTPGGASILRGTARRVVQQSALKEVQNVQGRSLVGGALEHYGLMQKVEHLEQENMLLKSQIRDLNGQLSDALARAERAEAAAAAAEARLPPPTDEQDGRDAGAPAGLDVWSLTQSAHNASFSHIAKEQLVNAVKDLAAELLRAQEERRKAHDKLVEFKGAIRVLCRVRPAQANQAEAVQATADEAGVGISCNGQDHGFVFSRVFGASSSQQQVFSEVSEVVQSALDGYHVCLMSYGQTGSGKTYSMLGKPGHEQQAGIIPRAVDKLISEVSRLRRQGWQYSLEASCMELYNNNIRDLLMDPGGPSSSSSSSTSKAGANITDMNAIKHDVDGTTVVGVSRHTLTSTHSALSLLNTAQAARAVNATNCNAVSSRSHCVFWIHIKASHPSKETSLTGALCLVDLAGSERLDRSGATGDRKTEAAAINGSLSALGDVFEALSKKNAHVPYRNSKLTYLLKSCLSKGGKTLFMVHISPEGASAYESLTSLRFATKVAGTELGQATKKATSTSMTTALASYMPAAQQRQVFNNPQHVVSSMTTAQLKTLQPLSLGQYFASQGLTKQEAMTTGKVKTASNATALQPAAEQGDPTLMTGRTLHFESEGGTCGDPQENMQQQRQVVESVFIEGRRSVRAPGGVTSEAVDLRAALRRKRQLANSDSADCTEGKQQQVASQSDQGSQAAFNATYTAQPLQKKQKTNKGAWY